MKRKVIIGLLTSSLLLTPIVQVIPVFAQDFDETNMTTMTTEEQSSVEISDSHTNDSSTVLSESLVPLMSETEVVDSSPVMSESMESSISTEVTASTVPTEETIEMTISSESVMAESVTEEVQYEEVFYNGQWFQFPVQPDMEESVVVIEEDHALGSSVSTETPMLRTRASVDQIDEKQKGRPKWDFIDVSSHNRELSVKDYEYMKKQGVTGVVVKLTEYTTYENPYAEAQIANALAAGLKVSTYHYSHFKTRKEAEAEATYYAAMAKRLGLPSSTIMVNDLEDDYGKPTKFNTYSTQNSIYFANKLKALGYPKTLHYSNANTFKSGLLATEILGLQNIWIAQYPYTPSDKNLLHTNYAAWQWSDSMRFTEIKGKIFDVNMDYTGIFSNRTNVGVSPDKEVKPTSEKSMNQYATIVNKGFILWNDLSFKKQNAMSDSYFQKTLYAEKEYTYADGLKYVAVKNNQKQLLGYVDARALTYVANPGGIYLSEPSYATVISQDDTIWQNFEFSKDRGTTGSYYEKTLQVKGKYNHYNGATYYTLYTNDGKWVGYMNAKSVKQTSGAQGTYRNYAKEVTLKGTHDIWRDFSWKTKTAASKYKNQTLHAKGMYNHFNGTRYLSLYDKKDQWLGYVEEAGVAVKKTQEIVYRAYNKYVTIKGNYDIWRGFDWKIKVDKSKYKNQTLHAKGMYDHFNGSYYYTLYDNQGKWVGYINENGVTTAQGQQGIYQEYRKYVTINGKLDIWHGFDWQSKMNLANYKNKTFFAKGIYHHFNGSRYYSLYDNQGKWLGYVNEGGATLAQGEQGIYQEYGKYVTINGKLDIWHGFDWRSKMNLVNYTNKTFFAKGVYRHFNGSRYYSIYDNKGKWLGYVNESGVNLANAEQGVYQDFRGQIVINGKYDLWHSFGWTSKTPSAQYINQTLQVKGAYGHFSGARYYSVYDNQGKWIGYMHEDGGSLK